MKDADSSSSTLRETPQPKLVGPTTTEKVVRAEDDQIVYGRVLRAISPREYPAAVPEPVASLSNQGPNKRTTPYFFFYEQATMARTRKRGVTNTQSQALVSRRFHNSEGHTVILNRISRSLALSC